MVYCNNTVVVTVSNLIYRTAATVVVVYVSSEYHKVILTIVRNLYGPEVDLK